jgi:TIR domain
MATLRELFGGEFGRLLKRPGLITSSSPGVVFEIPQTLYCDFDACACFLGCYIAEEFVTPELLHALIQQHQDSVSSLRGSVGIFGGHIAMYPPRGPSLADLPFTGRIILYVDATLEDAVKQSLVALGNTLGVWVQIRDRTYEEFVTRNEKPLAFISHDSRDKDDFVRPLAEKLITSLCPVWYDEFSMKPGDSLRESIDAGLRDSKRCVVVLSHNFFTNPGWGQR